MTVDVRNCSRLGVFLLLKAGQRNWRVDYTQRKHGHKKYVIVLSACMPLGFQHEYIDLHLNEKLAY